MDDRTILNHIDELIAEEKQLRSSSAEHGDDQRARLRQLEEQLDQAWDLLRQRRAKEEFDQDPDAATERSVGEVEGYRQ